MKQLIKKVKLTVNRIFLHVKFSSFTLTACVQLVLLWTEGWGLCGRLAGAGYKICCRPKFGASKQPRFDTGPDI